MRTKMVARRQELELSQQDVADYMKVTRSAISGWETGRNEPSLPDIIKLKILLKVDDDSIFLNDTDTISVESKGDEAV